MDLQEITMSLNRAQIMGNLGQDPETRYMPSGEAVTNLSIATTDKWKDKESGEQRERTEWHRVSFFGRRAEVIAEYFRKGDQIFVEGQIQTRKWQDKEGNDRYTTEINGRDFQFCGQASGSAGSRPDPSSGQQESRAEPTPLPAHQPGESEEIPF